MVGNNLRKLRDEDKLFNIAVSLVVLEQKPASIIHEYITGKRL